jgi:hypothetical protein
VAETVAVSCEVSADGWLCAVDVRGDDGATHHVVTASRAELARFAPGATEPAALVEASFDFLLAREPKESILRRFALSDIERYFPDFRAVIRARN